MSRNMTTSLIEHDRIRTTVTRAKELRRVAEQMVTLAKSGVCCDEGIMDRRSESVPTCSYHRADKGGNGSSLRRSCESLQVNCESVL